MGQARKTRSGTGAHPRAGLKALDAHVDRILDRLLALETEVVWICAIAGSGKSHLLRSLRARLGRSRGSRRPRLLDDPTDGALRAALATGDRGARGVRPRIVVASRPGGAAAKILLTSRMYGEVSILDETDLFIPQRTCQRLGSPRLHALTGGWPMLVAAALARREAAVHEMLPAFLSRDVLPTLPASVAVAALAATDAGLGWDAAKRLGVTEPHLHPLFVGSPSGIRIGAEWVVRALKSLHADPVSLPEAVQAGLIDHYVASEDPSSAILALQAGHRADSALALFERCGGPFFGFRHGFDAHERILDGFDPAMQERHESLLGARVFLLFRTGRAHEALRRLEAQFPGLPVDLRELRPPYRAYPLLMRIDIAVDLDELIDREVIASWGRLEGLLPPDDQVARGILYNTMAIAYLRKDDTLQARQMAEEALEAYRRSDSPYLMHCMLVHLTDVALRESRLADAGAHLREATAELRRSGFGVNSERAILAVYAARLAYEEGRLADAGGELAPTLAALVKGDSWPGLIRAILGYAPFVAFWREGLRPAIEAAEQCILALARRHGRFEDRGLTLLHIRLLQIARRHSEADDRLAELDLEGARPRSGHLSAEEGLIRLRASLLRHAPLEPDRVLARTIGELPALGRRQRITLGLLQAFLQHRLGDARLARRHLVVALRSALSLGASGVLLEDAEVLERLLPVLVRDPGAGNEPIAEFAQRLIAQLRRLPASGLRSRAVAGLTRQEHRALVYVADGCSNKEIARALALSESAVKFHLRNLFRKLKVRRRADLLERVRERGLLP